MNTSEHQISYTQGRSLILPSAFGILVFSVYIISLAPKWATLHISGLLILLSLVFSRRVNWRSPAMRMYILITCAWLVPVIAASIWQHIIGIDTATEWTSLLKAVLRMLGIGMGIIFMLQKGWLTPKIAVIAALVASAMNLCVGYYDWMTEGGGSLDSWRSFRMDGLIGNPNPFGTFTALTIIICAGLLRDNFRSIILWSILLLSVIAIWASGSRGAILVTAAGLLALFPPLNRRYAIGLLLAAIAFASIYALTDIRFLFGRNIRMELIIYTLQKILEAPFSGWGMDAFETMPGRPRNVAAPHNMLLDLAVTSGVVAVLGWLLSTAKLSYELAKNRTGFSGIMLALFTASIVSGILEYSLLNSLHFESIWMLITAFSCWSLESRDNNMQIPVDEKPVDTPFAVLERRN